MVIRKNFFNKSLPNTTDYVLKEELSTGVRAIVNYYNGTADNFPVRMVILDANKFKGKKFILSCHAKSSAENPGFLYSRIVNENGAVSSSFPTLAQSTTTLDGDLSIKFTIPENLSEEFHFLGIALYATRNHVAQIGDYVDYTDLKLELGETITPYTPYFKGKKNFYLIYMKQIKSWIKNFYIKKENSNE